jgi:hypothetical protein
MTIHNLANEVNRINGALEILGLLRERLTLQLDEMGAESGREAVDEMLTHVDALQLEYLRRSKNLHPHHKSYQFFLTDKGVSPILHESYIDLVSGKAKNTEFAGQTYRLADWYVRMKDDVPQQLVNETYGWLTFDDSGRLDLHAAKLIDTSPLPTEVEHKQIKKLIFSTGE